MLGYISSSNEIGDENAEFPFVSFEDILMATDNFSDSKQIGKGGFGKVYKVRISVVSVVTVAHAFFCMINCIGVKQFLSSFHNSG